MNSKLLVRISALLLAFILILCGCGDGKNDGATLDDESIKNTFKGQELSPFEQTVEITYPYVARSGVSYAEGESGTDNWLTKLIEDQLNIKWTPAFDTTPQDLTSQLSLSFSTDSLPDVFSTDDPVLSAQLIATGAVTSLDEYIENYATENLLSIINMDDKQMFNPVTKDGKAYAIPAPEDALNRVPLIFIRSDWMNNLGLKEPETIDDLMNIAYAFVKNDPDGNGADDTYGIPMDDYFGFVGTTLYTFANPLGAYYDQWVEKDGKLVYGNVQPEMKQALSLMNQAYANGLFKSDFSTNSIESGLANGKYGIFTGVFHSPTNYLKTHYTKYGVDWNVYPIPAQADGKYVSQIDLASRNYIFVKADFKHPEALIKTLNLYAELKKGNLSEWYSDLLDDEKYKDASDSFHMYFLPCEFADPFENYDMGLDMAKALENNDTGVLKTSLAKRQYEIIKKGGADGWATKMYTAVVMPVISNYKDNFHYDAYNGPLTESEQNYAVSLDNYTKEVFLDIIKGKKDISAFDAFVEQWYKQGGTDWTEEVNDWYSANK